MGKTYAIPLSSNFLDEVAKILQAQQHIEKYSIFLPNRRSCRELKKRLPKDGATFLPKLTAISDLFEFNNQKIIMLLVELLKKDRQSVPFSALYELAESLRSLINELILNNIDPKQLSSMVPEALQKYWIHTISVINSAMTTPEIQKNLNSIRRKLDIFCETTEKVVMIGINEVNNYARLLLKKAEENGIIIGYEDLHFPSCEKLNVEFLEFNSLFEEGFGVAVAVRKAVFEQKSVMIVSQDQDLTEIIKSELKRWNIFADDSRGTAFSKTSDGILVSSILDMLQTQCSCTSVLNVLKMSPTFGEMAQNMELFFRKQDALPPNFFMAFDLHREANLFPLDEIEKMRILSLELQSDKSFPEWLEVC
ncbi:MAG: hypothetical protein LBO02_00800, partial [Holosporaceae bacterium]|nr:hypothetical protein [Holosporaceae bacterium]